jgi:hypothetical protein
MEVCTLAAWDELTNNEKLDRLTTILTRAGSDLEFRERCLKSPESAKQAIAEVADIEFPDGFVVEFLTPKQRMKKLVLTMPDYIPPQDGVPEVRNAEDYQPCTYNLWRT